MHPKILTLPAPAKINHFLHICGQRDDGYHNLQTVFQFLTLSDTLHFSLRDDEKIVISPALENIADEQNLIYRAARALQNASGCTKGADIHIEKIIPMGAGLGGGSSNAATTLVGLNRLWQLAFSKQQLQDIGVKLGADVPIFIYGYSAWAEGIGEKLTPLTLPENTLLLCIPDCHVSTAKIFSHPLLTRNTEIKTIAAFLAQGKQNTFKNDCENLVREIYPDVDFAFTLLNQVAKAKMTGTGACIFAEFTEEYAASQASDKIAAQVKTLLTQSTNLSPLYQALQIL